MSARLEELQNRDTPDEHQEMSEGQMKAGLAKTNNCCFGRADSKMAVQTIGDRNSNRELEIGAGVVFKRMTRTSGPLADRQDRYCG